MDVSIVIINYNTFDLTTKCIKSIYEFSEGFSFEIILVDNASNECDPELFKQNFPSIYLLKSKNNLGFSGGNNLGIKHAKGEYILLLNSDTELVENSIKKCLQFLKENKQVGVVSPKLIYPNGNYQSAAQRFPSVKLKLLEFLRLHKFLSKKKREELFLGFYFNHDRTIQTDWVWGTFFMFPKAALQLLPNNKLNDDYFMYYEDMQWCMDINKIGYEIYYYANTKVIHHMGGSSGKKNELMIKNRVKFIDKNYSGIKKYILKHLFLN